MGFSILHSIGVPDMSRVLVGAGILILAGCASSHKSAPPDPKMLAAIPGDLRMMGAETTWVAHGVGYELVTRSKPELLPLISQLDDQSRFFAKVFGADPGKVIATVRRVGPPGSTPEASAPVPFDVGPVVEIVVMRPLAKGEKAEKTEQANNSNNYGRGGSRGRSNGASPDGPAATADEFDRFGANGPTAHVVRAWLSARATALTGKSPSAAASSATADDPRVPAWAEDGLPGLAVPTAREDTTTARLAMQIDSLFPIHTFLTMARPGALATLGGAGGRGGAAGGRGGSVTPNNGGGNGGGGSGGMGGLGGMSERRGGAGMGGSSYGRGGMGAGRGQGGTDGGRPRGPLMGNALFEAQSLVFGRYLVTREGPAFVGALIDAQIQSHDIAKVFDAAQMVPSNLERLDIEFHRWLIDRAAHGK